MEYSAYRQGSESQDSDEPAPPGTTAFETRKKPDTASSSSPVLQVSSKGVENAKKRLRAFSIQKKSPMPAAPAIKPPSSGNTTVLIGRLSSVKVTPKPEKVEDDPKKPPKPPKPGGTRKYINESYTDLQKKTLSEIEDMKRKMELVELGIPLGLICPSTNALPVKCMPTKAMPPIKTFLDSAKVDAIIREAKKAKAEGKEFKFDYQKFVPDYDNPFQRKKDLPEQTPERKDSQSDKKDEEFKHGKYEKEKDRRKSDRHEKRYDYKRISKEKLTDFKEKDKSKDKKENRSKDKEDRDKDKSKGKGGKHRIEDVFEIESNNKAGKLEKESSETDVNLNDYLVCDSWSLDNETAASSPQVEDKSKKPEKDPKAFIDPLEQLRQSLEKSKADSPKQKVEKLKPVIDSFKFEIDPNDDEILDIFDKDSDLEKYAAKKAKKDSYYSPSDKKFHYDSKDAANDCLNDDTFLESVINEIKQEDISDDSHDHDKGLVEYDESPDKDCTEFSIGSVTPELDDKVRLQSQRSDYSDGYRSTESRKSVESFKSSGSSYKSSESGYKSTESGHKGSESGKTKSSRSKEARMSIEREMEEQMKSKISKDTVDSLETWSFVLKICQPLLFRHDKEKCYKETRVSPKLCYTQNPKLCSCVKDRSVVYEELEMCKMMLVNRLYGCDPVSESPNAAARSWYPPTEQCLVSQPGIRTDHLASEWDIDEAHTDTLTPQREEVSLDKEYQRFMEAVSWPEVEGKQDSRSTTPVRHVSRKKKAEDREEKKKKKIKLSSEGWSQESDVEEEKVKPQKEKKEKVPVRKRKHSPATISSSDSEDTSKKRKKIAKKKKIKKIKTKTAKRRRLEKKMLKKLKDKKKKKKKEKIEEESELEQEEKESKKKSKKEKEQRKKKAEKKKRAKSSSSSSSSSSDSSSESDSESEKKAKKKKEAECKKKKKDKKKRRKQSTSDSTQDEELFDVNILKNIKTERLTDDERKRAASPAAPARAPREIIDVKQLQDDFSSTVQIKVETEEDIKIVPPEEIPVPVEEEIPPEEREEKREQSERQNDAELMNRFDLSDSLEQYALSEPQAAKYDLPTVQFKEPEIPTPPPREDTSQCSSQESILSVKDYEKDESHLRPSSQNSNYSFNDVMASQSTPYKGMEDNEGYENYDMYEQLAMKYQNDVASQEISPPSSVWSRIETVVGGSRGEIKCDWRATDPPHSCATSNTGSRPSRWGLKPGEVNIVLTGGSDPAPSPPEPAPPSDQAPLGQTVYKIQSLANRTDTSMSYDEAYLDTYGAADRLQYGDCFAAAGEHAARPSTLDHRISQVLAEVAKEESDKETADKGILVTKSVPDARGVKRVSFADGYRPGQDSDVEEPPVKKRKKSRRLGCPWPCPSSHPDHVPLWDALPPPPPPPGSPPAPPPRAAHPPLHLLRHHRYEMSLLPPPPHAVQHKFDPTSTLPNFMPPEPPPGLISFP